MKLKSLFLLTVVTATIAGCSSNEPNINPRLSKPLHIHFLFMLQIVLILTFTPLRMMLLQS